MELDDDSAGGPCSVILDMLAGTVGAAIILLVLRWLGFAIPLLHQLGFA